MPPVRDRRSSSRAARRSRDRRAIAPHLAALLVSVIAPQQAAAERSVAPPPASPPIAAQAPFFDQGEIALGSASAPVTVVEYLSTTCPHCAAFERDTWLRVKRTFVDTGQVRMIIREMPTAPVAVAAAGFLLARCAGRDRYWEVVQALLDRQAEVLGAPSLAAAVMREREIARVDPDAAEACLSDPAAIDAINARRQAGLDGGVDSTPYFIVDGRPLRPGVTLAGEVYAGGELSFAQFAAAVRRSTSAPRASSKTPRARSH